MRWLERVDDDGQRERGPVFANALEAINTCLRQHEGKPISRPRQDFGERLWPLNRRGRSEPGGERVSEPRVGVVSRPGDISVGANEHGGGRRDRAKRRKRPRTGVFGVDQLNAIRPWPGVEGAGLIKVE